MAFLEDLDNWIANSLSNNTGKKPTMGEAFNSGTSSWGDFLGKLSSVNPGEAFTQKINQFKAQNPSQSMTGESLSTIPSNSNFNPSDYEGLGYGYGGDIPTLDFSTELGKLQDFFTSNGDSSIDFYNNYDGSLGGGVTGSTMNIDGALPRTEMNFNSALPRTSTSQAGIGSVIDELSNRNSNYVADGATGSVTQPTAINKLIGSDNAQSSVLGNLYDTGSLDTQGSVSSLLSDGALGTSSWKDNMTLDGGNVLPSIASGGLDLGLNGGSNFEWGDIFNLDNLEGATKIASAIGNLWTGYENSQTAKDSLAFQKDSFNKNFANQVSLTNTNLSDRQNARYSADPNSQMSVEDYMAKNRVG